MIILAQKVREILVYPKYAYQVGCQNLGSCFAALQLFTFFVLRQTSLDGNSPVFINRRRNECHVNLVAENMKNTTKRKILHGILLTI